MRKNKADKWDKDCRGSVALINKVAGEGVTDNLVM